MFIDVCDRRVYYQPHIMAGVPVTMNHCCLQVFSIGIHFYTCSCFILCVCECTMYVWVRVMGIHRVREYMG